MVSHVSESSTGYEQAIALPTMVALVSDHHEHHVLTGTRSKSLLRHISAVHYLQRTAQDSMSPAVRLWELAGDTPSRVFSPFAWRVRLVLNHKQIPYESASWRYADKGLIKPCETVSWQPAVGHGLQRILSLCMQTFSGHDVPYQ